MIHALMCYVSFPWFEWAFIIPPIVIAILAHGFLVRRKTRL